MKRRNTRNNKIQYGKSFRYGSSEAAIKDLSRLAKRQKEAKVKKVKHKYELGQRVWFLKSVRLCEVTELHEDGTYTVEVMDSGKRLVATEDGLALLDGSEDTRGLREDG